VAQEIGNVKAKALKRKETLIEILFMKINEIRGKGRLKVTDFM